MTNPPSSDRLVGIIVAMTRDGVIGLDRTIPWKHSGDLRRFKRVTLGTTVIMGRVTYESLPQKPLVGRENIVVTRSALSNVRVCSSVAEALSIASGPVWLIGGASIYREGLALANILDITYVPEIITADSAVRFPEFDPTAFVEGPEMAHEDEMGLFRKVFVRRVNSDASQASFTKI